MELTRSTHGPKGPKDLHLHVLASGSKGNCAVVEGPGGLIMVDNGLSRREALARMDALASTRRTSGRSSSPTSTRTTWAACPSRRRRFDVELFASAGTPRARAKTAELPFREFDPGDELSIAGVRIKTFATSHDVVNPVGLRFSTPGDDIGYVTDTGFLPASALEALRGARIIALESNHDVAMLRCGPYPRHLQDRIASDGAISPTSRPPRRLRGSSAPGPNTWSPCTSPKRTTCRASQSARSPRRSGPSSTTTSAAAPRSDAPMGQRCASRARPEPPDQLLVDDLRSHPCSFADFTHRFARSPSRRPSPLKESPA